MLTEARRRIDKRPDRYVDHIYGEKEAGGTTVLYLSAVPFEKLGFPKLGPKPFPAYTKLALRAVAPAVMALGAVLGLTGRFLKRREELAGAGASGHTPHVEYERLGEKLLTPFNWVLIALMTVGALSMVARFTRGLGGSTNLSDTYPWGLWISVDFTLIAFSGTGFTMAAIVHVLHLKKYQPVLRPALLAGRDPARGAGGAGGDQRASICSLRRWSARLFCLRR